MVVTAQTNYEKNSYYLNRCVLYVHHCLCIEFSFIFTFAIIKKDKIEYVQ